MHRLRVLGSLVIAFVLIAFPAAAFADTSFGTLLSQLEQEYQLPSGILWKIALAENGGKATGCSSSSSACGMFQFITSTWLADTKALFGKPLDPSLRNDPTNSARAAAYELATIRTQIGPLASQANVNLSAGLYLGYFLGSGGARRLLSAYLQNPAQSACALLPSQCSANQSVMAGRSLAQLINWAAQKMQASGVPNIPGNFQDSSGVSYAYSYGDIQSSNFLPANTPIPANPYGADATVFPSTTNGTPSPTSSSLPISSLPTTANPTATNPSTAAQPTAASTAATSGSACTPQYYCSNNTVYYQSNSCSTSVFQACMYGCLGTICAQSPAVSSSSASLYTQSSSALGATLQPSGSIGNPVIVGTAATSTSIVSLVSSSSSTSTFSDTIVANDQTPTQGSLTAASSSFDGAATYDTDTLTANSPSQTYASAPSPLFGILDQLKSILSGLLSYLGSL